MYLIKGWRKYAEIGMDSVLPRIKEKGQGRWAMLRKSRRITFNIPICVESDGNGFYAYCPALKGVHVDGDTKEEALENAKTASLLYIKSLIDHGDPIPLQIIRTEESTESYQRFSCSPLQTENVLVTV